MLTRDALADGALLLYQSSEGYRFGIDAVILATDLPDLPAAAEIVELGAGQGAVALQIARQRPTCTITALELQETLFALLAENVEDNELGQRVRCVHGDVREFRAFLTAHTADLVVCNPPYTPVGSGRTSPNAERAAAHQELNGTLGDFLRAAQYVLKPRGWLKLIIPPARLGDLHTEISTTDFKACSVRFAHARADANAYLMEWVFRRGGAPDLIVRPPLYVRQGGELSEEMQRRCRLDQGVA